MKGRHLVGLVLIAATTAVVGLIVSVYHESQHADYAWTPKVAAPAYSGTGPRVVIDEAHHNASKGSFPERYWPFARLLRADGYRVSAGHRRFSEASLAEVDALVIVNASGASQQQAFGINLPLPTRGERGDPAFTADEVRVLTEWVERGGSLLLIADHAPFGAAAEALGAAFHVTFGKGFVEVPSERSDPLEFSRANGRLGAHPIVSGQPEFGSTQRVTMATGATVASTPRGSAPQQRAAPAGVGRVETFTGQSLSAPPDAAVLLRLPSNAVEYVRADTGMVEHPAGQAQGVAMTWGRGRVVILGEAAMLTAQVSNGERFGLQVAGNDNQAFALNVMRWLTRAL